MMPQDEVWSALVGTEEEVAALRDEQPESAMPLWQTLELLGRRLTGINQEAPSPAGKEETLHILQKARSLCVDACAQFASD